jgi:hypothetical protein
LFAAGLFLFASWTAGADAPALTAKAGDADPTTELAEGVRKLLDKSAVTVADKDGEPVLTVWFRAAIPAKATAEQVANGLTYRELPEGVLVGAVKFHRPFVDYRKQEVATGVYTMRFLVQPDVGDHVGTAPHPEFLVLSPADRDTDPEPLEPKTLIKLSSATTGGDHPGVMLLFPHAAKEPGPRVLDKGDGVAVLAIRRAVEADGKMTMLGFAVTVTGHSKTR